MTTTEAREELARRCEGAGSFGEAIDYLYSWDDDCVLAGLLEAADIEYPTTRDEAARLLYDLTGIIAF